MLQVAYGGFYRSSSNSNYFYDSPVYYEPGFSTFVPLEISVPNVADRIYILIRRRIDDTETVFDTLYAANMEITVKDPTIGATVPAEIYANSIHTTWDSPTSPIFYPLVAYIDPAIDFTDSNVRVRVLDCYIKDTVNDNFIIFRVYITDQDKLFYYIPVTINDLASRYNTSAIGTTGYMTVYADSDSYMLISPFSGIEEVSKESGEANFSYPLDSVYYKRQKTYNEEDFTFTVGTVSDTFVTNNVSVMNVPGYSKVGVVHVDRYMYQKLLEKEDVAYMDVNVEGKLSGIQDSFRVVFRR